MHAATGIYKHLQVVTCNLHINPESDLDISSSRELEIRLFLWAYLAVTLKNVLYKADKQQQKTVHNDWGKRFNSFQTFPFNLCICFVFGFDFFLIEIVSFWSVGWHGTPYGTQTGLEGKGILLPEPPKY